jgi:hypothetical protein
LVVFLSFVCSYAHQKQLVASFETLLTHSLFSEKTIVSWPFFCNVLQEFFCTHLLSEDFVEDKNVHGLASSDFEFIRTKFFGRANEVLLKRFVFVFKVWVFVRYAAMTRRPFSSLSVRSFSL